MRRIAACALVVILLTAAAEAKKKHCTLRLHLEGNASDGPVFSSQIQSRLTGKSVTIQKAPAISENDVVAFTPYSLAGGTYGVLFHLNDHGKLVLDTLSVERRGTFAYIFVNGRNLAELQIDRRVSDGKLYVASDLTQADIDLMKKDWRVLPEERKK